jgi:hypothetical protein
LTGFCPSTCESVDAGIDGIMSSIGGFCPMAIVSAMSPVGQSRMSHMVCCHWKNKGWCKFQATCRFQHPPDKRGTGKSLRVNPRQAKKAAASTGSPVTATGASV